MGIQELSQERLDTSRRHLAQYTKVDHFEMAVIAMAIFDCDAIIKDRNVDDDTRAINAIAKAILNKKMDEHCDKLLTER